MQAVGQYQQLKIGDPKIGAVLVVGGGIAGMQASLDLAESGFKVYLLESSPAIGGKMVQLDKTFPTGDCAMCTIAPRLVECASHPNIEIMTLSQIDNVKGEAGNFKVTIKKFPRYVNEEECNGCGICVIRCPVKIPDEYNKGLSKTKCIHLCYSQAVPAVPVIDESSCIYLQRGKCRICEKFCEAKAIDFKQEEKKLDINVGSIILAPGFDTFDARIKGEYGYGRYKDVITSIEFERILSAAGPYGGEIRRPSDGKVPQKIAFIQCVGSRDKTVNKSYCSAVCCMYTAKEAIVAKEHLPEAEITIFFIDVRAYGKGFETYYERAKNEYGVKYVRCMASKVSEHPQNGKLKIKYIDNNHSGPPSPKPKLSLEEEITKSNCKIEEFDLVVLAVGIQPSIQMVELSKKLGIELTSYNFCSTHTFSPLATSKPGVFVAGVFQGPKDIPEAVMQGLGAASETGSILSSARHTLTMEKEYPLERDVSEEQQRIGVFICHCGRNIASVIDVESVARDVITLPDVVHSETNLFACSPDGLEKIRKSIKEHNLNRVVVASCTPRTHEILFRDNLREAGLNPYLFEMANIRDQCSWVHSSEPDKAALKAKSLIRMAVSKARYSESLKMQSVPVIQKALIIGGGLTGMVTALSLANQGFEVYLVEKEGELGGNLRKIYYTLEVSDVQECCLEYYLDKVKNNPLIHIYTKTEVKDVSGFVGNFKTAIQSCVQSTVHSSKSADAQPSIVNQIEHGVIIVATGGEEYKPDEYLYGRDKRIITQRELEERIVNDKLRTTNHELQTAVMIQCVGSRDDKRPYCSRICCSEAVKNALKLKELNPKTDIFVLYRDIRTYGMKEIYYHKALEAGVIFIRYDEQEKPIVTNKNGQLKVEVLDQSLKQELIINADLVVLSTGITPHSSCEQLASLLKVPLNEDKFFLEAHIKLRPVDFATEGIFLCGLAHSPKFIDENISQAKAAAARAATILSKESLKIGGAVAVVDEEKCATCLTCIRVCPYDAPSIDLEGMVKIEPAKCQGCGICAGECPAKAIQLQHFKDIQIVSGCEELLEKTLL